MYAEETQTKTRRTRDNIAYVSAASLKKFTVTTTRRKACRVQKMSGISSVSGRVSLKKKKPRRVGSDGPCQIAALSPMTRRTANVHVLSVPCAGPSEREHCL